MTNNEAAKWIQLYIDLAKIDPTTGEAAYLNEDARKTLEAMGMAVDALISKQDADDTISRRRRLRLVITVGIKTIGRLPKISKICHPHSQNGTITQSLVC